MRTYARIKRVIIYGIDLIHMSEFGTYRILASSFNHENSSIAHNKKHLFFQFKKKKDTHNK